LVYFLEIIGLRSKGGFVFALRKIKEEMGPDEHQRINTNIRRLRPDQPIHCLRILQRLYTGILGFGQSNQKLGLLS
jgi:hypothetical protein